MVDSRHDPVDSPYRLVAQRYRLETAIGRGAMGTVWAGTDEMLHRPVAVKELKLAPGLPEDEAAELRERALREARAMAVVSHPNIVTVYDVAWSGDIPFVVMELVTGHSLATVVERHGPLSHQLLAQLADSLAAALQAAHRVGIVHRDVKPGNVLVGEHGEIKLGDFGIARNNTDPTLTRSGHVLGTPAYLAPEVVAGEEVAEAVDRWSLGATLFTAAEGRRPYDNSHAMALIASIIYGEVPQHRQTGPMGAVISGLMVKDPSRRMSLDDVRRWVHSLLPTGGTFGPVVDSNMPGPHSVPLNQARGEATTVAGSDNRSTAPDVATPARRRLWPAIAGIAIVASLGVLASVVYRDHLGRTGTEPGHASPPPSLSAYSLIEAEQYSRASPAQSVKTGSTQDVVNGNDITYAWLGVGFGITVSYEHVDFGPAPPGSFTLVSQTARGVDPNLIVELRVDDPRSPPIAAIPMEDPVEEGWWVATGRRVSPVTGTHDVYLTLAPKDGNLYGSTSSLDYVLLDSFQFFW